MQAFSKMSAVEPRCWPRAWHHYLKSNIHFEFLLIITALVTVAAYFRCCSETARKSILGLGLFVLLEWTVSHVADSRLPAHKIKLPFFGGWGWLPWKALEVVQANIEKLHIFYSAVGQHEEFRVEDNYGCVIECLHLFTVVFYVHSCENSSWPTCLDSLLIYYSHSL